MQRREIRAFRRNLWVVTVHQERVLRVSVSVLHQSKGSHYWA